MSKKEFDIVAIAPHPDDAEIFCGGALASAHERGHRTAIIDLTRGELASNGTVESRAEEAEQARITLGVDERINLRLPDGGLDGRTRENEQLTALVKAIRELKPKLLLIPFFEGRHPDHRAASELSRNSVFFSGLKKFLPEIEAHRVPSVLYYQLRFSFKPSLVLDVSATYEKKRKAIACYSTQVKRAESTNETLLNSPLSLRGIESRDMYYGAMIGAEFGEPFYSDTPLRLEDPMNVVHQDATPVLFQGSLT